MKEEYGILKVISSTLKFEAVLTFNGQKNCLELFQNKVTLPLP